MEASFELEKALEFQRIPSEERLEKSKKLQESVKERNSGKEFGPFTKGQSKGKKRNEKIKNGDLNQKYIQEVAAFELNQKQISETAAGNFNQELTPENTTGNLNQELIQETGNTETIPIQEKASETNQWALAIAAAEAREKNGEIIVELDKYNIPSWELGEDSYRIRILENINIERWAWENIQEKQNEVKNGNLQNDFPSLVANENARLLFPPSREEQRKNKNKQNVAGTFRNENGNRPYLEHNFIILQYS
ncbi:hypothetical protein, partial [Leptospira alstonii]